MTYPISEIEGMTAFSATRLKSQGIRTTDALLEAARTVKGRKVLAAKTGISEQQLLEWANVSDYMRIPGMGKAKVGLVRAAGVTTVRELALRNPARLAQNIKEVNTRRKLVRVLPSEKSVEQHNLSYSAASGYLDSHAPTAQSDRMVNAPSRKVVTAAPGLHPVLRSLLSRPIPAVMGVLNVTPDSFSDGGQFLAPEKALAQARRLIADGADIIDIGAESTRPYGGAQPVSADMELRRLQPVLAEIVSLGVPVSIDSMKADVVAWALEQGAAIANDVWGLQRDGAMAGVIAARNAPVIAMHNRERVDPGIDIMQDISDFFARSLEIAARAGIARENIVLDPGIGFGKTHEQSLIALANLSELDVFGLPVLVGASRKVFIASVSPSEPQQRLGGSIAAHLLAAQRGARIIRTHDVAETVQSLLVQAAIEDRR